MKSRFTEEQIIKILKEHEGGKKPRRSLEKTIARNRPFTAGKVNTAVWNSARPNGLSRLKKETVDKNKW